MALATAKRVGELSTLSMVTTTQERDLVLSYLHECVAKTGTGLNPIPGEFCLCSLSSTVGYENEERLLCSVRAVNCYLQLTSSSSRPRNLFVSVWNPKRPMSKAAISFFLRDTVKAAS